MTDRVPASEIRTHQVCLLCRFTDRLDHGLDRSRWVEDQPVPVHVEDGHLVPLGAPT